MAENYAVLAYVTAFLAVCGYREEEAVHRRAVPHERRMAWGTGMSARRADGTGARQQPH